jgi:hypothetical protein
MAVANCRWNLRRRGIVPAVVDLGPDMSDRNFFVAAWVIVCAVLAGWAILTAIWFLGLVCKRFG